MNPRVAFRRHSLLWQFAVLLAALLLALGALSLSMFQSLAEGQALHRAKAVASMAEVIGRWVAQYNGVWVRSDSNEPIAVGDYLDRRAIVKVAAAGASDDGGSTVTYHHKPASLVQREMADLVSRIEPDLRLRITSDKSFNPKSTPGRFEMLALVSLREAGPGVTDYYEVRDGSLLYARRLVATAECMGCHDTAERAPAALRARYPSQGYGYRLGDVVGLVSVTVPVATLFSGGITTALSWQTWAALAAVAACFALLVAWVLSSAIGSTRQLERFARRVVQAKPGVGVPPPLLDQHEVSSQNEVHRLSASLKAITRALKLSQNSRY